MKELGSGITYNTHNTTSLIRTLKYVSDVLQTEEAFTVEEYKHTPHTHRKALDTANDQIFLTDSLIMLAECVLKINIFEHNNYL